MRMNKYTFKFMQLIDIWAESEDEALSKAVGEVDGYEDTPIHDYDIVETVKIEEGKPYKVVLLYPFTRVVEIMDIPTGTPVREITRLLENKRLITAYDMISECGANQYTIMRDNRIIGFVTPHDEC